MRYSFGGMWGQAVYFAKNSAYARVLVGEFIELNPDSSLRVPPTMKDDPSKRYDSVKGSSGGSDVYMIYANKKAYP